MTAKHLNQMIADEHSADLRRAAARDRAARTVRRAGPRRGPLALRALIALTLVP
jgi:hypothetical protein